jgi:hypothetical protein
MVIRPETTRYRLIGVSPTGRVYELQDVALSIRWEEQPNALAEQLKIEIPVRYHQELPLGAPLLLYTDTGTGEVLHNRYTVFRSKYADRGERQLELTAYDRLIYLLKSKGDAFYPAGTTAQAIVEDVAAEWEVPIAAIADGLDLALGKQVYRTKSVADMIRSALAEAWKLTGWRYHLQCGPDGIVIRKEGGNAPVYWLHEDQNVAEVIDERDIEDLVTRVRIIGSAPQGGRAPVYADVEGLTEFGVLQEIVTQAANDSGDKAIRAAETILRERGKPRQKRTVKSLGVPDLRRGDVVRVTAGSLDGFYLVNGISQDAGERSMTVEVRTPYEGLELYDAPNTEEGEERAGGSGGGGKGPGTPPITGITEPEVY